MTFTKRPEQQVINPNNPIEEYFLKNTSIYFGQHQKHLMVDQISMESANNDLTAVQVQELVWPTKVVSVSKKVQHALPGRDDLIDDEVFHSVRVPCTPEEAVAHYAEQAGVRIEFLQSVVASEKAKAEKAAAKEQSKKPADKSVKSTKGKK